MNLSPWQSPAEYYPGDRVYLDMPGDPNDGRIGVIEVSHPVYIDKPWQCVRIAERLVNLPEVLLRPMEGGDPTMA